MEYINQKQDKERKKLMNIISYFFLNILVFIMCGIPLYISYSNIEEIDKNLDKNIKNSYNEGRLNKSFLFCSYKYKKNNNKKIRKIEGYLDINECVENDGISSDEVEDILTTSDIEALSMIENSEVFEICKDVVIKLNDFSKVYTVYSNDDIEDYKYKKVELDKMVELNKYNESEKLLEVEKDFEEYTMFLAKDEKNINKIKYLRTKNKFILNSNKYKEIYGKILKYSKDKDDKTNISEDESLKKENSQIEINEEEWFNE